MASAAATHRSYVRVAGCFRPIHRSENDKVVSTGCEKRHLLSGSLFQLLVKRQAPLTRLLKGGFVKVNVAVVVMMVLGTLGATALVGSAQQTKTQWNGIYTEAQAARGEPLYAQNCASCHGPELTGGEMAP